MQRKLSTHNSIKGFELGCEVVNWFDEAGNLIVGNILNPEHRRQWLESLKADWLKDAIEKLGKKI